jgi:Secretion system C-terminal sorting domain
MKKSFILMLFSVLLSSFALQGQTAVLTQTGCNSIRVAMTGGCFGFEGSGNQQGNGDWILGSFSSKSYQINLSKKQPNGNFSVVVSSFDVAGNNFTWTNLAPGEYAVSAAVFSCSTQRCFNTQGQLLGFKVFVSAVTASNSVILGLSEQSDIAFNFLDANGSTIFGNTQFFAPNEEVKINTSAIKNYDKYLLAIQEFYPDGVTQGRWRGFGNGGYGGWQTGQMPNIVSLTNDLWSIGGTGWQFIPGYSYRLQIVLSKDACPSWTQSLPFFYICQSGWGCRAGGEKKKDNKIILSPNPASNKFRLDGINFIDTKNCSVSISDISGKEVQRFNDVTTNEFAINGLMNGVYIVSITADNRRLFSSKLVVNH